MPRSRAEAVSRLRPAAQQWLLLTLVLRPGRSLGIWGSAGPPLLACPSGWHVPAPSVPCGSLSAWTSQSCVCAECHPLSVTIHVATENGCGSKRGHRARRGEVRGPLPLPAPQHRRASGIPCRKRTGLEHPRESVSLEAPLDQTAPPLGHRERLRARPSARCSRAAPPPAPARPGTQTPDPRPPAQRARWELSVQDHKPSSALTPTGRASQTLQTLCLCPPPTLPLPAPPLTPPRCQGPQLTFSSLPAPPRSLCKPLDALTVLTLGPRPP